MNVFDRINETQNLIDQDKFRYLPFNFGWFNKLFPGMLKDVMLLAGQSSSAKSSFAKFLYLSQAIEFCIEKNIKYHCLFYALEDTATVVDFTILLNLYWKKYKEIIDIKLVEGLRFDEKGKSIKLTSLQLERLNSLKPTLDLYKQYYTVYDSLYKPDDIHISILTYAAKIGKFYIDDKLILPTQAIASKRFDKYIQNEETFVTVLTDNVNLLDGEDLYKDILHFSFNVGKKSVVKQLGFNFTMVQQLADNGSDLEHIKANAWLPSGKLLGQAKKTNKDSRGSIGISNPYSLGLKKYQGYDLLLLKSFYRCVNIFKQTVGNDSYVFNTLFIPHVNQFYLLPPVKNNEEQSLETNNFIMDILTKIKNYED